MMSRNPILNENVLARAEGGGTATATRPASPADEWARAQQAPSTQAATQTAWEAGRPVPAGPTEFTGRRMSLGGVCSATFLLLMLVVVGGWFGWSQVTETPVAFPQPDGPTATAELDSPGLLIVALLVAFGFAILTAFKPMLARFTAVIYALTMGFVLGAISHLYDAQFDGIVVQAILATASVFLVMLALYGLRILRVTPRMAKGIIGATMGVLLLYVAGFVMSFFGVDMRFWTDPSPLGILISLVIVGIAAFNLLLDFDFIEKGTEAGLPAAMDWYGAFGLLTTLVWLYLEMLRLLAKLRSN